MLFPRVFSRVFSFCKLSYFSCRKVRPQIRAAIQSASRQISIKRVAALDVAFLPNASQINKNNAREQLRISIITSVIGFTVILFCLLIVFLFMIAHLFAVVNRHNLLRALHGI